MVIASETGDYSKMEDKDNGPLIVGGIAGLLFAAFLFITSHQSDKPTTGLVTITTPTQNNATASESIQSDPTVIVYNKHPQAGPGVVYECLKEGQRVFSDSPCGNDARTRTISPVNSMEAHQPIYQPNLSPSLVTQTATSDILGRDCSVFEKEVKRIDARMRQGYTSTEGEWLRDQRRNAAAARDACTKENRLR